MINYEDCLDLTREEYNFLYSGESIEAEDRLRDFAYEEAKDRIRDLGYKATEKNVRELLDYYIEANVVFDEETAWDSAEEEFVDARKKDPKEYVTPEQQMRIDERLQRIVHK